MSDLVVQGNELSVWGYGYRIGTRRDETLGGLVPTLTCKREGLRTPGNEAPSPSLVWKRD